MARGDSSFPERFYTYFRAHNKDVQFNLKNMQAYAVVESTPEAKTNKILKLSNQSFGVCGLVMEASESGVEKRRLHGVNFGAAFKVAAEEKTTRRERVFTTGGAPQDVSASPALRPIMNWDEVDPDFEKADSYWEAPGLFDQVSGKPIPIAGTVDVRQGSDDNAFQRYGLEWMQLCADQTSGDGAYSQALFDHYNGSLDENRNSGLNTFWWVKFNENDIAVIARVKTANPADGVGYGFDVFTGDGSGVSIRQEKVVMGPLTAAGAGGAVIQPGGWWHYKDSDRKDQTVLAKSAWDMGGHEHGGHCEFDQHTPAIGINKDGEHINPEHIWKEFLIYADMKHDAGCKIEVKDIVESGSDFPYKMKVHFQHDPIQKHPCRGKMYDGLWYWEGSVPLGKWTPPNKTPPGIPDIPLTPGPGEGVIPGLPLEGVAFSNIPIADGFHKGIYNNGYVLHTSNPKIDPVNEPRTEFVLGMRGIVGLGAPANIYEGQIGWSATPKGYYEERLETLPQVAAIDFLAKVRESSGAYFYDYDLIPGESATKGGTTDGMIYICPIGKRHFQKEPAVISELNVGLHEGVPLGWLDVPDIDASLHNKNSTYFKPYWDGGKLELELIGEDSGGVRVCTSKLKVCNLITSGTVSGFWTRDIANTSIYPTNVTDDIWFPNNYGINYGNTRAAPRAFTNYNVASNEFRIGTVQAENFKVFTTNNEIFNFESDGTLSALTANYEALVLANQDMTNKKYVDDAVIAAGHLRLHAMTNVLDHSSGNWKIFGSNGAGQVIEIVNAIAGNVLTAGGVAALPTWAAPAAPALHAASHENLGADEISVLGLSGLLADDQHVLDAEVLAVAAPLVHAARHENGGLDEISVLGLSGLLADDQHVLDAEVLTVAAPLVHATRHENGGADEISVADLSGLLADDQHVLDAEVLAVAAAKVHAAQHENDGDDEISVLGLSGLLADDQSPLAHAVQHVTGGDDVIADAIAGGNAGLLSGAELTNLNANSAARHTRLHAMTNILDHSAGAWKIFASNTAGQVVEIASVGSGNVLTSAGVAALPVWAAPAAPLAHAASHAENAADEILVENLGTAGAAGTVPTSDGAGGLDMATPGGGVLEKVLIDTYQGDGNNNRKLDLGDDYDEVWVFKLGTSATGFTRAYAVHTAYGTLRESGTNEYVWLTTSGDAAWQGKLVGADINKVGLGSTANTNSANNNGWNYQVIAKKYSSYEALP